MRTIDDRHFNCSSRERAAFEAGIKLGSLFHQFIGTPVSSENREQLEKAMEGAIRTQPHVESASITIDSDMLKEQINRIGYSSLGERMLKASVVIRVGNTVCEASLGWDDDLDYPLMAIDRIGSKEARDRDDDY